MCVPSSMIHAVCMQAAGSCYSQWVCCYCLYPSHVHHLSSARLLRRGSHMWPVCRLLGWCLQTTGLLPADSCVDAPDILMCAVVQALSWPSRSAGFGTLFAAQQGTCVRVCLQIVVGMVCTGPNVRLSSCGVCPCSPSCSAFVCVPVLSQPLLGMLSQPLLGIRCGAGCVCLGGSLCLLDACSANGGRRDPFLQGRLAPSCGTF